MYSNVHGTVGASIVLATYAVTNDPTIAMGLGGFAAFLSHDPVDRLGEKSYGDLTTTLTWEAVPFALFAYMAYLSGIWELYAVGWVAGNGMDMIDKKMGLALFWRDRFSFGRFFPCHRRAPNINLTLHQTKLATYLCSLGIVGMTFF